MQKALIIDDSKAIRRILGSAVRELGFEVSEAENGREALETLIHMQPPAEIVLVDWNMPEMNGLEFVNQVRADGRWNGVKLMMVTSVTEADQMIKALTAGADEYIMKPFTKEVLHDKLRLLGIVE
jgi:two-component system, chemotaxis family, chemotaxis protein CheY